MFVCCWNTTWPKRMPECLVLIHNLASEFCNESREFAAAPAPVQDRKKTDVFMILVQPKEAKTNCLSTNLIHTFQPVEDGFAIPALEIRQPSWDFNPYPRGLLIHLTTPMSTPTSKTTILYSCWFLFHLEKLSINLRRPPNTWLTG